jgi:YVTN family beta-propeller protein
MGSTRPNLQLVPGTSFFSSAFYPSGFDIRGLTFTQQGRRAYVVHRNSGGRENPAAVVAIDRTPDAAGQPVDRAVAEVEVCAGATQMHLHDSGRGPRLFVVCFESGQVYVVDPDLMAVTAVINAGRGPNALTFPGSAPTVGYLTGFGDNNVSVIDLRPGSPTEYQVIQRLGFPKLRVR